MKVPLILLFAGHLHNVTLVIHHWSYTSGESSNWSHVQVPIYVHLDPYLSNRL